VDEPARFDIHTSPIGIDAFKKALDIACGLNAPTLGLTNNDKGFETLLK
jgi:hypothetical protein